MARVKIEIGGDTSAAKTSIKDLEQSSKKSFSKMSKDADKSSDEISKAFKSAGIRTEKAIRQSSEKAKRDYEKIKNSGVASANDIKRAHNRMTEKIKKNNRELRTSSAKVIKIFDKIKTGIALAAVAAIGFFGIKALSEAIKFETALIELQKVLNDTEGDAKDFTDQVEKLSKTFGEAQSEVLQGVAIFKQAGFEISESFLLQESAMKLAASSELDVAEAAELMKRSLKGFKAPASEVIRLTDVLNEISNNYGTNLKQLALGMADISPIAKKMGFSFEETVGLLTPIIEVFGSGSEAAQALRTGLVKLLDDTPTIINALGSMGIKQHELNGAMRSGRDIYLDVAKRFETLEQNMKLVVTAQLTGVLQSGKLSEVYDGLGLSTEITNKAMKAAGSINKETAIFLGSTAKKADKTTSSFNIMAKVIGEIFIPTWRALLSVAAFASDAIVSGIRGMSKALDSYSKFIVKHLNLFGIFGKANVIKDINEDTKRLNKTSEDSIRINKQQEESIEKVVVALIDVAKKKKEEIELIKKQTKQIEINLRVELDALNVKARLQKEVNEATEEIIKATKAELDDLEDRLDGAVSFLRTIEEIFAQSAKEVAQAGLGPVEKIVDDIKRAAQELKKVQGLLATNTKASIATAETILKNAAAVIRSFNIANTQAGKIALQAGPSGVSTQGLTAIATSVQNMQQQVLQLANQMQTMAQKAIPPVVQRLSNLQQQALQGKKVIDDIKQDIKDATRLAKSLKDLLNDPVKKGTLDNLNDDIDFSLQAAKDLKDKLSEDTTATHAQIINTVRSGSEEPAVQGFSTGVKLPGYGGGDKILARLEAGERVIKKEAVRNLETLGSRAMTALHKGDIKGLIDSLPLPGFNQGGKVESSTPSGTTNVNLNLNNKTFPMTSKQSVADKFVQEIKSMNIIHGRKKNPY